MSPTFPADGGSLRILESGRDRNYEAASIGVGTLKKDSDANPLAVTVAAVYQIPTSFDDVVFGNRHQDWRGGGIDGDAGLDQILRTGHRSVVNVTVDVVLTDGVANDDVAVYVLAGGVRVDGDTGQAIPGQIVALDEVVVGPRTWEGGEDANASSTGWTVWAFAGDESAGGDDLRPCVVLFHPLRGQPGLQRHTDPNGQVSVPLVPRLSGLQALRAIDHPALVVPSDRGVMGSPHPVRPPMRQPYQRTHNTGSSQGLPR